MDTCLSFGYACSEFLFVYGNANGHYFFAWNAFLDKFFDKMFVWDNIMVYVCLLQEGTTGLVGHDEIGGYVPCHIAFECSDGFCRKEVYADDDVDLLFFDVVM